MAKFFGGISIKGKKYGLNAISKFNSSNKLNIKAIYSKEAEVQPKGKSHSHEYVYTYEWTNTTSCIGKRVCITDETEAPETCAATITSELVQPWSHTQDGITRYTATFHKVGFKTQTKDVYETAYHTYGEPTYTWNENKTLCTAKRVCADDGDEQIEETVPTFETTTPATCLADGVRTYTARFVNEAFEMQTATETIDMLGHSWGTPTYSWNADGTSCTATRICTRDASHVDVQTATISSVVKVQPTCTSKGTSTVTATFSNAALTTQVKDFVNIEPLWHDYSNATFTWSGTNCTAKGTCSRCGKSYTQTNTYDSKICLTSCTTTASTVSVKYIAFFRPDESLPLYSTKDGTETKTDSNVLHTPTGNADPNAPDDYGNGTWRCSTHSNITNVSSNAIGTETVGSDKMVWYLKDNVCYLYGSRPGFKMKTYGSKNQPWYSYRKYIHKVYLDKTIAKFEPSGFYPCSQIYQFMADINHPLFVGGVWSYFIIRKSDNAAIGYASGSKIRKVTMPYSTNEDVKVIGSGLFASNGVMEELDASYITKIESNGLSSCRVSKVNLWKIQEIGERAFESCSSLQDIRFGGNLKKLGAYAFINCYNLEDMYYFNETSLEKLEEGCFSLNSKLKRINLPSTLKEIGKNAFEQCEELETITIPSKVTKIDTEAFSDCSMLSITVPDTVTSIGENAFKNVAHVYYNGTATGAPWGAKAYN